MNLVGSIGKKVLAGWRRQRLLAALTVTALVLALNPRNWPRTTRDVLARQILFTGFEATRFVALIALLVGVAVVVQIQFWLTRFGQSGLLGPLLVTVVIREVGPLLTNFIVIGRSGAAISTELANMKVNHEIRVMDAQGLDPMTYLVMPRVLGVGLSIFCLTVLFIAVCLISGYASGLLFGIKAGTPWMFTASVMGAVRPADLVNLLAKTLLPGMIMGTICSQEGLSVVGAVTEVPQAATRGIVRSVLALFIISAIVSVLTYV